MWFVFAVLFFLAAVYFAGKAEFYKRRYQDPWTAAWDDFSKRQRIASKVDPRHPSSPRSIPS